MTEISEQFEDSLNKLKSIYRLKLKEEIPYFENILKEPFTKELLEDLKNNEIDIAFLDSSELPDNIRVIKKA